MKKILLIALLLVSGFATAADDVLQEQKTLNDQFTADKAEYAQLTDARTALAKRNDDLAWAHNSINKHIDTYKADRADLKMRYNAHKSVLDDHNSRCNGTFEQSYATACNNEAAQIDITSHALNAENDSLSKTYDLIQTAIQTGTEESEKVAAADKAAMARQNELAEDERKINIQLNQIDKQVVKCQAAIAVVDAHPRNDTDKEIMHARCGAMFDGNKN